MKCVTLCPGEGDARGSALEAHVARNPCVPHPDLPAASASKKPNAIKGFGWQRVKETHRN
jgi:hypothetical protein